MFRLVLKILFFFNGLICNSIHLYINLYKIFLYLSNNNFNKIWILDIDNTLANTWPTLIEKHKYKNELHRLESLHVLEGSKKYYLEVCALPNHGLIFLSARPLNSEIITQKWLDNHDFWNVNSRLVLVPKVKNKIPFLKLISIMYPEVFYIDDLSYNHENGKVLLYDNVIKTVKKMKLIYFDNHFIQSLNNK